MPVPRLTAWLRPVLHLLALASLLALAACGGGNGAPNNQFTPPPPPTPALLVAPNVLSVYSGVPATVTITSGVPPFTAFSSDATVLPVSQAVPSGTIVLLANQVAADQSETITVHDAVGQTALVSVTVHASVLLNSLTFAPSGADCGTNLCSGQNGTATVTAKSPTGAPLAGRQIRFDVISGPISFVTTNPASPLAQTLTLVTDNAGAATVSLQAPANATTQPAQIRATDVTTGQAQVANFTVVNATNATQSPITVVPSTVTITAPFNNICSSGFRVDYYIYGGNPPYTVSSTFPTAVTLVNSVVPASGGFFEIITNGTCVNPLTFAVQDSAGKQPATLPQLINNPGSVAPTPAPNLVVSPGTYTDQNCTGKTYPFVVTGGTAPYNAFAGGPGAPSLSTNVIGAEGGSFAATITAPNFSGTATVTVIDSTIPAKTATATITCTTSVTPPPAAITLIPPSPITSSACTGNPISVQVNGGTGPYNFFVVGQPPTTPFLSPQPLPASGVVTISGLTTDNGVADATDHIYQISIVDTGTPAAAPALLTINCR